MPILKKIVDVLEKGIDALVTAMMIVMGVSIVIQVFARYVLNNPTGWSEELARYIFVWITMLGSAVVLKQGKHVEVGGAVRCSHFPFRVAGKRHRAHRCGPPTSIGRHGAAHVHHVCRPACRCLFYDSFPCGRADRTVDRHPWSRDATA